MSVLNVSKLRSTTCPKQWMSTMIGLMPVKMPIESLLLQPLPYYSFRNGGPETLEIKSSRTS